MASAVYFTMSDLAALEAIVTSYDTGEGKVAIRQLRHLAKAHSVNFRHTTKAADFIILFKGVFPHKNS